MSQSNERLKINGGSDSDEAQASSSFSPSSLFLEHIETPLNACSLETFGGGGTPIQIGDAKVWPLMLGCYELNEAEGRRMGQLDFYAVPVPTTSEDGNNNNNNNDDDGILDADEKHSKLKSLGKPISILKGDDVSGVLDGKWCPMTSRCASESSMGPSSASMLYATAHASGEIQIHSIQGKNENQSLEGDNHHHHQLDLSSRFESSKIGQTEVEGDGICLAISWDMPQRYEDESFSTQKLVSSYSDGHVAIHALHQQNQDLHENEQKNDTLHSASAPTLAPAVELELLESWSAHKMFHSPAEVWAASFTTHQDVVLTGGDEGQLKIWDLRTGTTRPIHAIKNRFEAGVTVISPHPRKEHWVACGSYDETMALLDLRYVPTNPTKPNVLCHSDPLGGGLWRIKWHPKDDNRLLLGAMHGGCRVVDLLPPMDSSKDAPCKEWNIEVRQKFTLHKSMAYGADWLFQEMPPSSLSSMHRIEAVASCSFYDKALYLWAVHS